MWKMRYYAGRYDNPVTMVLIAGVICFIYIKGLRVRLY